MYRYAAIPVLPPSAMSAPGFAATSDGTRAQRLLLIGKWVKLAERKQAQAFSDPRDRKIGRGRPEGGVGAASRQLGIPEPTARRAVRIAKNLKPAARKAATKLGLENRTHVLDGAAKPLSLPSQPR
jgi:ParB family chromosome partitioning protein